MARKGNDEENFEEGTKAAMKLLRVTEVPESVQRLLEHPKVADIKPDSDIFWCLFRGKPYFFENIEIFFTVVNLL